MSWHSKIIENIRNLLPGRFRSRDPVVAVVRLQGTIGPSQAMRQSLNLENVAPILDKAFAIKGIKAVALAINSPGGSAAQSHLIFDHIKLLAQEKELPVFVFAEDVAASGGYMIACAGDEIYATPASIIGSIGVVSSSFGFDRFIEHHHIERRVYTAGKNKAMLDPFQPENPDDVLHLKRLQEQIHVFFKDLVRASRKERLNGDDDLLFSGAFWLGPEALSFGLIDGIGDMKRILRAKYGEKLKLRLVAPTRPSLLARLLGRGTQAQLSLIDPHAAFSAIEERSLWSRFGL